MKSTVLTTVVLELSEDEYEDLYEAVEAAQTAADASDASKKFSERVKKLIEELPAPLSRTRW